jgi:chemotaxis protein MotB
VNPVAVAGHLAQGDVGRGGPDPWRLSADRAQLARTLLEAAGVADARMSRVTGKADRGPVTDDPRDERNRRVEITLLRRF